MPRRGLIYASPLVLIGAAWFAAACDGGEAVNGGTSTRPSPGGTTTVVLPPGTTTVVLPPDVPTATAGPPAPITEEELRSQPALQEFLASTGGDIGSVLFEDLTGSGAEEAVVPVASGGEGGDIAVFVFGRVGGELRELLHASPEGARSIKAGLEGGQLVTTEGILGPNDPLCCPSQLRLRFYEWDGSALVIEREELQETE